MAPSPLPPEHPFSVQVSDLLDIPGARRRVSLSGFLALELDQIEKCGPVRVALDISETGGSVLVRGEVTSSVRLRCNRCLGVVPLDLAVPVVQLYGDEPDDDVLGIEPDGSIDLSEVIHDELCLSMPLVPLCSETCQGLCPACGTDLNADPCEGHTAERGSPFSALEGWLDNLPGTAQTFR